MEAPQTLGESSRKFCTTKLLRFTGEFELDSAVAARGGWKTCTGHSPVGSGAMEPSFKGYRASPQENMWFTKVKSFESQSPSGKHTKLAIENGPVEIVDFPIANGDFL